MRRALWLSIGGGLAFAITVAFVLRSSHLTSTAGLALVGLTPLLVVPLIALAISAWVSRAAVLRLATFGLAIVYFATYPTVGSVLGCQPESAEDGLVIFDLNVRYRHGDPVRVAEAVGAAGADVVVLQEVWPGFMAGLAGQPAMAPLRYRATEAVEGTTGLAIWSRWPLENATLDDVVGVPQLTVDVDSPGGRFALTAVHTLAPTDDAAAKIWSAQLNTLGAGERTGPTVLAGDFNATADHAQFRGVLKRGWTDVHEPKGCGFDATWPRGRLPLALLRLDHVLVSEEFEVLAVEIGPDGGSDHASVIATVRLRDPVAVEAATS